MSKSNQTNIQEEDNRRTYMAMSTLEMFVNKTHHGRMVKCIAIHESYASKSQAVEVRLDITCKYLISNLYKKIVCAILKNRISRYWYFFFFFKGDKCKNGSL